MIFWYNSDMEEKQPKDVEVLVPNELRSGVYANIANINVTKGELVLNFVFANESDKPEGTLVSRVILTRKHARLFLEALTQAVTTADELDPD